MDWDETYEGRFSKMDSFDAIELLEKLFKYGNLANSIREYAREEFNEIEYNREHSLNDDQDKSDFKGKLNSTPFQIRLLYELGFFDLPKVQSLEPGNLVKLVMELLNRRNERDIRGNINGFKPESEEDITKYTAASIGTGKRVTKFLNNLE